MMLAITVLFSSRNVKYPLILLGKPPPQVGDSKSLTVPGVEIKQPSLS
jgi:hypothetical protein